MSEITLVRFRLPLWMFWCIMLLNIVVVPQEGNAQGERDVLVKQMLGRYNKTISPGLAGSSTDIGFILCPTRISKLDDKRAILTIESYVLINWNDKRLSWDTDQSYSDLKWISVASDSLWKPNFNIFNRGRGHRYVSDDVPAYVGQNGKIWWSIAAELYPVCSPGDMRWFPGDIHTCQLLIGALYPQKFFDLYFGDPNMAASESDLDRETEIESPHWEIVSAKHEKDYNHAIADIFYPTEKFTFTIRRCRPLLMLATFCPILCCSFLSWASFLLSPREDSSSRRLSVATVALVLNCVILLALVEQVPGTGEGSPVVVTLSATSVIFCCFSSLHAVIMCRVVQRKPVNVDFIWKLPPYVQTFLGVKKSVTSVDVKSILVEDGPDNREEFQREHDVEPSIWDEVVEACDRAHLFLQILVFVLIFIFATTI